RLLPRGLHRHGDGGRPLPLGRLRDRRAAPPSQGRDRLARRSDVVRARRHPLRLGHAVLAPPEPALQEPVLLRHGEHLRRCRRYRPPYLQERDREALGLTRGSPVAIGAGVSGLSFANWWRERHPGADVVILEAEPEPGGYCRTVVDAGFVWDYSGHFFHFKDP